MSELIQISTWQPEKAINVIFVHGLGGHPYYTWRRLRVDINSDETFWPKWIGEDIKGADVFTLGYDAPATGWLQQSMSFEDRTRNLAELLMSEKLNPNVPVLFVCHSLGGLLVKRLILLLEQEKETREDFGELLRSVSGIVFLGTPHQGAIHASLLDWLRIIVWPSPASQSLVFNNSTLRDINVSFRNLMNRENIDSCVLFETRRTLFGKIVHEFSADPGLPGSTPIGVDANHIQISKPENRQSLIYRYILNFVRKNSVTVGPSSHLKQSISPYRSARSIDIFGIVSRVAIVIGAVFAYHKISSETPADKDSFVNAVRTIASIPDAESKVRVTQLLFNVELNEADRETIGALTLISDNPLPENILDQVINASTQKEAQDAVSLAPSDLACSGQFDFIISDQHIGCANGEKISYIQSPNTDDELISLEALVFHSTVGSFQGAVWAMTNDSMKVSSHLLISREGEMIQMIPFGEKAWHASNSSWSERGLVGLNSYSVAVSFENEGELNRTSQGAYRSRLGEYEGEVFEHTEDDRLTYWEPYSHTQIEIASALVKAFRKNYPDIGVLTHSEITSGRVDPGPAFPIEELRSIR